MRHYMVPDVTTKTPAALYLDAFYTLEPQVPDGVLYWKYRTQDLPLLGHLSRADQVSELHRVAGIADLNSDFLYSLAGLISCDVVDVNWLASSRWRLQAEPDDRPALGAALGAFSEAIMAERPTIGRRVAELTESDPHHGSAHAIRTARIEASERALLVVPQEFREEAVRRFRSHLEDYMRADEAADVWAGLAEGRDLFGGHLADVFHDLESNSDLVPLLEDRDWTHFNRTLGGFSPSTESQSSRVVSSEGLAVRIGLTFLASLPKLHFRDAEQVAELRTKCGAEIEAFHRAVMAYVEDYQDSDLSARALEALIKKEIPEDVDRLIRARADRLGIEEAAGGGSSLGLLILTSAEPISFTILALALLPTAVKAIRSRRKSLKGIDKDGLRLALRFS